jgi:hypothetical protein
MVGAAAGPTALGSNTLAAWVNFNSLATDGEIIEVNASGGGNGSFDSAILWNLASSKLEFTQRTSTTNRDFVATFTVNINTWIHVALTWDGTNLLAYANGVQIGSNTTGAMAGTRGNWGGLQLGPATADIQDGVFYSAALSADEIGQLYRERQPKRRNNLLCWVPCFPGSNRGLDLSGNANNLPASGTPTDSTIVPPSVGWGSGRSRIIIPAGGATAAAGDGRTIFNGSGAQTAAAAASANGQTVFNGSGTEAAAVASVANGQTVFNGSGAQTAAVAKVADGRTVFNGAATSAASSASSADGRTVFNGAGAQTAAAAKSADGRTVFNASGTAAVSIAASGDGRTLFNASASTGAAGTGQTTFNASATATVSIAATADGRTVFNGTSTATASTNLAAQGDGQTVFNASATATVTVAASAIGLTVFNGASSPGSVVPVVDIPQRWTAAPRQTLWITTDPFQPQDYASVLGSKLVDYWHSELGIALDGSSNVQTWTGQLLGLVLNQTLGAGQRPNYGADASFGGRNVVQCRITGPRCLAYKPGTAIFNPGDRPGLVHISRYVTVPTGANATYIVNMGAATAPTPPAIFNNDFFDGTIITTAQRRGVIRTVNHFTPFGLTVFDPAPVTTSPSMRALGLTSTQFQVYTNGQLAGFLENNENLSESWDQLVIGANTESGLQPCDCNVAMVFLCRNMPSQFEAMQLYQLAKAEWGI